MPAPTFYSRLNLISALMIATLMAAVLVTPTLDLRIASEGPSILAASAGR